MSRHFLIACVAVTLLVGTVRPGHATEVQQVVSPGGIEAWLIESSAAPVVTVAFAFDGLGSATVPPELAGLANLTSILLDEGAGDYDSAAFQQRLADSAVNLWFEDRRDRFHGTLRTTTLTLDEAFELLRLSLAEPRFDPAPVERMRELALSQIRDVVAEAYWLGWRAISDIIYADHAYGLASRGTVASVLELTADDLRGFVGSGFTRDRLIIGVAGDIDAETLAGYLDHAFGDLPATGTVASVPPVPDWGDARRIRVDREGAQSRLMVLQPGIPRIHPDFYAASVLNHILGGGVLDTRLMMELRQRRGLTYGINSGIFNYAAADLWVANTSVATENLVEAAAAVTAVFEDIATNGVTEEEVADAVRYMTGSYPLGLTSTESLAGRLIGMQLYDLGPNYIDERSGLLEAVTVEQVNAVAREWLNPDALTIVAIAPEESGFEADLVIDGSSLIERELSETGM